MKFTFIYFAMLMTGLQSHWAWWFKDKNQISVILIRCFAGFFQLFSNHYSTLLSDNSKKQTKRYGRHVLWYFISFQFLSCQIMSRSARHATRRQIMVTKIIWSSSLINCFTYSELLVSAWMSWFRRCISLQVDSNPLGFLITTTYIDTCIDHSE